MIKIDRERDDEHGQPIRPNETWFKLSKTWTTTVLAEGVYHSPRKSIYAHNEVRKALEKLFYEKCAFCETKLIRSDWNVDHYRPKGRVAEREDHPGYYWLTYDWKNLYPTCVYCNQGRKDRARWNQSAVLPGGGKKDHFPLADERTRACVPTDPPGKEERLLLDPCWDNPERHLLFDPKGEVFGRDGDRIAAESIEKYDLRHRRLNDARRNIISSVICILKMLDSLYKAGGKEEVHDALKCVLHEKFLADSSQYAGVARAVFAQPERYGL